MVPEHARADAAAAGVGGGSTGGVPAASPLTGYMIADPSLGGLSPWLQVSSD